MIDSNVFLGLTKKSGQNKAEVLNLLFHLVRIDKEAYLEFPKEKRDDRVCIEIDNGQITKATIH
jgi:hypothetical protein